MNSCSICSRDVFRYRIIPRMIRSIFVFNDQLTYYYAVADLCVFEGQIRSIAPKLTNKTTVLYIQDPTSNSARYTCFIICDTYCMTLIKKYAWKLCVVEFDVLSLPIVILLNTMCGQLLISQLSFVSFYALFNSFSGISSHSTDMKKRFLVKGLSCRLYRT